MNASYTHEVPMGHRLQRHEGKCKHLHGHNYLVVVSYEGPVEPKSGMVIDFAQLKAATRKVLEPYDHAFVLEYNDPCIVDVKNWTELLLVLPYPPTAENLAHTWRRAIGDELAIAHSQIHIRVNETRDCAVFL